MINGARVDLITVRAKSIEPVGIHLALANTRGDVDCDELLNYLGASGNDLIVYKRAPPPPGSFRGAAVDLALLIGVAGSIASIASLLWQAYEKFVAPKKTPGNSAGIVVMIQHDDGSSDQFWIGHTDSDRDLFIRTFTARVEESRQASSDAHATRRVVAKLHETDLWLKQKSSP